MFYDVDSNTDTQDETLSQPYGDLFAKVKDMIDNTFTALDETTGTPRINGDMIVPYTESQSGIPGTMVYEEEMFDMEGSLVDYGGLDSYAVRVWNVRLENLDTFASPFYIARPVPEKPFNLDNEITMGIPKPMKISFEMLFKLTGSAASMNNHVKLSLGLEKLEAFASLLAKIDVTQLLSLQLKNVFNLYCWMDTILEPENHENPTAGIKDMIMGFQSIVMGLECVDCSGYMLHDLDDRLDSDSAIQAFTKVVNKILNVTAASVTSPEFQDRIDHYLSQSNVLCENPDQVATPWVRDESAAMSTFETSSSPDFTLAAASCATFLLVVIFACCLSSMSKRRKIEKQFRMSDKEREAEAKEKHVRKERRKAINARSVSMFRSSDEIPRYVRYRCWSVRTSPSLSLSLHTHTHTQTYSFISLRSTHSTHTNR